MVEEAVAQGAVSLDAQKRGFHLPEGPQDPRKLAQRIMVWCIIHEQGIEASVSDLFATMKRDRYWPFGNNVRYSAVEHQDFERLEKVMNTLIDEEKKEQQKKKEKEAAKSPRETTCLSPFKACLPLYYY